MAIIIITARWHIWWSGRFLGEVGKRGEKGNFQCQQHLLVAFFRISLFLLLMDTMKERGLVGSVLKIPLADRNHSQCSIHSPISEPNAALASGLSCVKLCRQSVGIKAWESENTGVPDLEGLAFLILLPLSASDINVLLCALFITDAFQGVLWKGFLLNRLSSSFPLMAAVKRKLTDLQQTPEFQCSKHWAGRPRSCWFFFSAQTIQIHICWKQLEFSLSLSVWWNQNLLSDKWEISLYPNNQYLGGSGTLGTREAVTGKLSQHVPECHNS